MRRSLLCSVGVGALLVVGDASGHPGPKVLDAVVASVDERPILWSEVVRRALPVLAALPPEKRAAARDRIRTETLERIVEERLIEKDGERLRITVTPDEVEQGIQAVEQANRLTHADLMREVAQRGLSEQDYRDDIRRQLFDAKWMRQAVQPLVKGSMTVGEGRLKRLEQLRAEVVIEVQK